jgi:hypothetical protein
VSAKKVSTKKAAKPAPKVKAPAARKAAPAKAAKLKTVVADAKPPTFAEKMKAAKAAKAGKASVAKADPEAARIEALADRIQKTIKETQAPSPMPVIQDGDVPLHTMAKSYVRASGAGKGKRRGNTFQCTVSFTETQMDQVVAAAQFRGVSLAEMIRSCVVEHLGKALN